MGYYAGLAKFAKGDRNILIIKSLSIPVLIHGIYDDDVKDEPTFKQVAKSMAQFYLNKDLRVALSPFENRRNFLFFSKSCQSVSN